MSDEHITLKLIHDLIEDRTRASEFIKKITDHCAALCPVCQQNLEDAKDVLEGLNGGHQGETHPVSAEARAVIERLRDVDEENRVTQLASVLDEYPTLQIDSLVEGLLVESKSHLPENPAEVVAWSRYAYEVLIATRPRRYDLIAQALAQMANGERVGSRLDVAHELLQRAQVAAKRSGKPAAQAEVKSIRGSLFTMLGRYDAAADEFLSAVTLMKGQDSIFHAKLLIKLGIVCDLVGDAENAITTTKRALVLLEKRRHTRLYLYARFNLAQHLFTAERFDECSMVLAEDEELWREQDNEWTALRLWWLEARLALEAGDGPLAERTLRAIRKQFIARGEGFETALVTLDLLLLYHRQERGHELIPVAEEALEILLRHEMHPEALTTLSLLIQSLKAKKVTEKTIKKCYRFLREASATPHASARVSN